MLRVCAKCNYNSGRVDSDKDDGLVRARDKASLINEYHQMKFENNVFARERVVELLLIFSFSRVTFERTPKFESIDSEFSSLCDVFQRVPPTRPQLTARNTPDARSMGGPG